MKCPKTEKPCWEKDCAIWNDEKNCCSIKVIAKELSRIMLHNNRK